MKQNAKAALLTAYLNLRRLVQLLRFRLFGRLQFFSTKTGSVPMFVIVVAIPIHRTENNHNRSHNRIHYSSTNLSVNGPYHLQQFCILQIHIKNRQNCVRFGFISVNPLLQAVIAFTCDLPSVFSCSTLYSITSRFLQINDRNYK